MHHLSGGLSRRHFLIATTAAALVRPGWASGWDDDFAKVERESGGKLGVYVLDTGSNAHFGWREDSRFPFCSSFKAPLAAFVLWLSDQGRLALDQVVRYGEPDLLPYAPTTRANVKNGGMTIDALCAAAVLLSDNTAANLLLRETGGPQALTEWMRWQGDSDFQLSDNEPKLNLSRFADAANTTTAKAMAGSFSRFLSGPLLTPASQARFKDWILANQTGAKRLRAGLPAAWQVGDKTGTFNEGFYSTVDIAAAWPGARKPIIISAFSTDTPDTQSGERALAAIARLAASWVQKQ
ncbi:MULTISPECIES: class A beta-lactamase [unclassified Pseudomonas]|uniref:class A beta-lactamase n=1 Tax=unclassified Pseudomonas TaxID=196821 RepID=UPI000BD1735F|nr:MULTISPECIES: class A beta-lactamase [unclassified Pseudomonas]PVZ20676.1 beta-lactamase class A [Pseudomonas sp. URIL14HWK12:I12]PVZ27742.1 beta-lactamase class A [Pseudomonas sp. URIL14HWK12:I10]PVZ38631.1 beta-lactamase class A [Pseudomonas sp. URIL14HWK12:I11]SNZ02588.1 beta-lactamase class A [Pseudomonas sp. URIL14HWK12:I9]